MLCPFCTEPSAANHAFLDAEGKPFTVEGCGPIERVEMVEVRAAGQEPNQWTIFLGPDLRARPYKCPRCGFVALFHRPEVTP